MAVYHDNPLLEKSFNYGVKIIKYCSELDKLRHYDISRQLLRSGTSIGANAQAAQSKRDFLGKVSISSKEARESRYFLQLLDVSGIVPDLSHETGQLLEEIDELTKILTKITKTTSTNLSQQKDI